MSESEEKVEELILPGVVDSHDKSAGSKTTAEPTAQPKLKDDDVTPTAEIEIDSDDEDVGGDGGQQ